MHCTSLWPTQSFPARTVLGSMGHIKISRLGERPSLSKCIKYTGLSQVLNRRSCPYLALCLIALSLSLGCTISRPILLNGPESLRYPLTYDGVYALAMRREMRTIPTR